MNKRLIQMIDSNDSSKRLIEMTQKKQQRGKKTNLRNIRKILPEKSSPKRAFDTRANEIDTSQKHLKKVYFTVNDTFSRTQSIRNQFFYQ